MPPHHRSRRGNRSRFWDRRARAWVVASRVERFFEPAVLLALRSGPSHGYELADAVNEWGDHYAVDSGNLSRMLRSLEEDGLVSSTWSEGGPGATRRVYRLEPKGERVLAAWVDSLADTEQTLAEFRRRHAASAGETKGATP